MPCYIRYGLRERSDPCNTVAELTVTVASWQQPFLAYYGCRFLLWEV